ncbi:UbiA family prenyltransferase [candidate division KSB1 bacterium]|nr:UbiA family prenyltransferase [candidate division KSB1 bacterium]
MSPTQKNGTNSKSEQRLHRLDYLFVLRPTLFFPIWTFALAGKWAQLRFAPSMDHDPLLVIAGVDLSLIIVLGIYTAMMGGVFVLNQIQDVETDRINNKLYLIANGDIPLHHAWILTLTLAATPFLLAFWARWDLVATMFLSLLLTGWAYSYPPLELMKRPIGGTLINIAAGYLVFSIGWMIEASISGRFFTIATPYVLGFIAVYFLTTVPDHIGDRRAGKITVAVHYGLTWTLSFGAVAAIAAVIAAFISSDRIALLATLPILPFFIQARRKKTKASVLKANKFAALVLSLIVCVRFPAYLALLTAVYFFTKWYYRKRFNIRYPSLQT